MDKEFLEIVGNGKPTGIVLKETIAASVTISISGRKMTQPNPSPNSFMRQFSEMRRGTRSPRGKSPSGRMFRWPCKDYLKGTCTNSFCESGTLQNAYSTRPRVVADLRKSALMRIARLMNSLAKRSKKNDDKSAVAMLLQHELYG